MSIREYILGVGCMALFTLTLIYGFSILCVAAGGSVGACGL